MLFSGINHQARKSPTLPETWEQGEGPNVSQLLLFLESLSFCTRKRLWSTLSKRESQWEFCLWKIIFSFGQDFYVSPSLSMTCKCWPQPLLHYLNFWGTRSSPWACFCLPCYSLGKQPRQIYVSFLVFKTISLKKTFHTMLFINALSLLSYNCSSCLSWTSVRARKL